MSEPASAEPATTAPVSSAAARLTDGEWHRLHPATPLLRGGLTLIAIAGIVVANLRDTLIELLLGGDGEEDDPIGLIVRQNLVLPALLVALGIIALVIGFSYLSWRFHQFRITDEVVEVRSGIISRTQRKARLDRIQGITIARPLFARIFGAARLEISVAGQDASVKLAYLRSGDTDILRRDVLALASGARRGGAEAVAAAKSGIIQQRVDEFLAPELDPAEAAAESVVHITPGRLIGSILLSDATVVLVVLIAAVITSAIVSGEWIALFGVFPMLIGIAGYIGRSFTRTLRYTIAGTPNGVRVGYGLLSTNNQTIPPGRVHAVAVRQPLLWRLAGWWRVTINVANASASQSNSATAGTTVLPVGNREDVLRVLALVLPDLDDENSRAMLRTGLEGRGGGDGFVNAPRRAAWLRPLAWRRTGFTLTDSTFVLRFGRIWRYLVLVPEARMQSVAITQGPLLRALRLASVHVHTVAGPVSTRLGVIDENVGRTLFDDVALTAVTSGAADTTHRWGASTAVAEAGAAG